MTSIWLAAEYHFPSTYSCRVPMSSEAHARVMPAPGPATVRLACIRTAIELFGIDRTREEIFPSLRQIDIRIRPPEQVAITQHRLRGYKRRVEPKKRREVIQESVLLREMAHAYGPMIIYVGIPSQEELIYTALLKTIGYWGQSHSFASCINITHTEPEAGEYALPLRLLGPQYHLQPYFSCLVSEFRNSSLSWEEIVPEELPAKTQFLTLDVYIWPLVLSHQQAGGKLFVRSSIHQK